MTDDPEHLTLECRFDDPSGERTLAHEDHIAPGRDTERVRSAIPGHVRQVGRGGTIHGGEPGAIGVATLKIRWRVPWVSKT